jgi:signal transduction histidine kinase
MRLPRIFRTASFRLATLYLLIFIGSLGVLAALLFFQLRVLVERDVRTQITNEVNLLLFEFEEDGLEELLEETEERIDKNDSHQRLLYMVQNPAGQVIFDPIKPAKAPYGWRRTRGKNAAQFYFTLLNNGYVLGVGKDLSAQAEFEQAIYRALLWTLGAALIIGSLGGFILSRRTLAQVEAISRTAQAIGAGRWSQRIAVQPTGDEFDQLGQTLNNMFERIEQLVANVRQVSTGIAHDLRTPLARLRNQLEHLRDVPPQNWDTAMGNAINEVDKILQTFAALLRLAELEAGALKAGFQPLDLGALARQMVEAYLPLGEDREIHFVIGDVATTTVSGDKHLLQQLVANLFENALQHAGAGSTVVVNLLTNTTHTILQIADNGVGIPSAECERIVKPFQRLDTSSGSGLGLALVVAIAQLHDAELRLLDNEPGLRCEVRFPVRNR